MRVHRNRTGAIDRVKVIGDRCSGTNFLERLVALNFPGLGHAEELGWKHGFCDRREADRPGLLVLVIYRHPIRWLQSFHASPNEVARTMGHLGFSDWIRAEWRPVWTIPREGGAPELRPIQADMIPHTTTPFPNVLAMRRAKIAWFEELARLPAQVGFLRYEDLNRDPQAMLARIAAAFDLARAGRFVPVPAHKGAGRRRYAPARHPPLAPADLAWIAQGLDLAQEAAIGYRLEDVPRFDGLPWHDPRVWRALWRGGR